MKAILTLLIILLFGMLAMARDVVSADISFNDIRKETRYELLRPARNFEKKSRDSLEVVRLYRFKNTPVLKELSFTTKRNKAKLA